MMQLIFTVALLFTVYFIGYAMGRKDIMEDIKQIAKEIDKNEV